MYKDKGNIKENIDILFNVGTIIDGKKATINAESNAAVLSSVSFNARK